jgi:5'(3')-deoxyribonucleotidase
MSNLKPIVYVDLDDTLCDFAKAQAIAISKEPGIIYPQSQYKFFENLEPIPGAIEGYKTLKTKYDVLILSRPSVYNPLSYTEKRIWVEKYFGFKECDNLILSCDKTLLRGKYLIDDMTQTGLMEPEWERIPFGSPKFPNWYSVLNYLM